MREVLVTKMRTFWIVAVAFLVLLTSCKMPAPATPTKADPQALFTAAAQTAEARRVLLAKNSPTASPVTPQTPTPPQESATPTVGGPLAATVIVPPTGAPGTITDKAEFVADLSVPDGEAHAPNEPFVKTWRLKNVGTTTWTTAYALVFISGALMSGPASLPMPKEVPPGEMVDISVQLIAPPETGIIQGFWKLRNASDEVFGVGVDATGPIWVTISVTPGAGGGTPTILAGQIVTGVGVSVNETSFTGVCPHTYQFTVQINLSQPATVTLVLEAGSDAGFEIKLPPPTTRNLEAGVHTIVYELTFSNSLNGWVRGHVTAPEDVLSKPVNFTLTCQ
jgi:hypothetical protein